MTSADATDAKVETPEKPKEELRYRSPTLSAFEENPLTTKTMATRLPQLVRKALALAWRISPRLVITLLTCQVLSGFLEAFGLLAITGTITALIASGHIQDRLWEAAPSIALLAGAAGLRALLGIVAANISSRLAPRIAREAQVDMLAAAVGAELTAYDHPGFSDRREAADRGADVAQDLLTQAQDLAATLASLTAAATVMTVLHPILLPLLVLAALPQAVASIKSAQAHYMATRSTVADRITLNNLRWFITTKPSADQIRSGTMATFLLDRYRTIGDRVDTTTDAAAHRATRYALAGSVAGGAATSTVWAALVLLLATGHMSIASAGTAVFALRTVSSSLAGMVSHGTRLFRTGLYLDDWAQFIAEAGGHRLQRGAIAPPPPVTVKAEALSYFYPGSETPALENVTLEVGRGEVLALVGENGSGKTTLSKLLSGLYLPSEGAVTWDGVDTRNLDPHALWCQTAVVPQEFTRWPMSARDNITLGQPHGGDETVQRAAEQSGAHEVVHELRSGLDTLLAREWLGGVGPLRRPMAAPRHRQSLLPPRRHPRHGRTHQRPRRTRRAPHLHRAAAHRTGSRRRPCHSSAGQRRHRRPHHCPRPRPHHPERHLRRTRRRPGPLPRTVGTAERPRHPGPAHRHRGEDRMTGRSPAVAAVHLILRNDTSERLLEEDSFLLGVRKGTGWGVGHFQVRRGAAAASLPAVRTSFTRGHENCGDWRRSAGAVGHNRSSRSRAWDRLERRGNIGGEGTGTAGRLWPVGQGRHRNGRCEIQGVRRHRGRCAESGRCRWRRAAC